MARTKQTARACAGVVAPRKALPTSAAGMTAPATGSSDEELVLKQRVEKHPLSEGYSTGDSDFSTDDDKPLKKKAVSKGITKKVRSGGKKKLVTNAKGKLVSSSSDEGEGSLLCCERAAKGLPPPEWDKEMKPIPRGECADILEHFEYMKRGNGQHYANITQSGMLPTFLSLALSAPVNLRERVLAASKGEFRLPGFSGDEEGYLEFALAVTVHDCLIYPPKVFDPHTVCTDKMIPALKSDDRVKRNLSDFSLFLNSKAPGGIHTLVRVLREVLDGQR